jgi:3-deoxy-D-manno-octulosonic-acid transferase
LYVLYRLIIGLIFYCLLPLLLLFVLITGRHRQGLGERFGLYPALPGEKRGKRIWLHAASVGEVQAARVLIAELRALRPDTGFVVTTMTLHGRNVAARQLGPDIPCLLAPLDVPGIVERAVTRIGPDAYVCLETELWPLLLRTTAARGIPTVHLNGRLSAGAAAGYRRWRWLFRRVLANFAAMAVISEVDRDRYLALGAIASRLQVLGNVKYDLQLPEQPGRVRQELRRVLGIEAGTRVLVAGSTHGGEVELLLPLLQHLADDGGWLVVVAPRHLERLAALEALFDRHGIEFDRFTVLRGGSTRRHPVVVLDSLGELFAMYAVATYVFCGGSLVPRHGHNLMEAAIWDKAVFYGPSMDDFRDAVRLLEAAGGGFRVGSAAELTDRILDFEQDPEAYRIACRNAGVAARAQLGAARRQARLVVDCLGG